MAGWRAGGALLVLAVILPYIAAAPLNEDTSLDLAEGPSATSGCYYNFQRYGEGDRIMTNEPCLNCTCHNRMLMCYLRVCPFTKPVGQDCTVEKRADQCCPIVTCPNVPVGLMTTSTSSPSIYGSSEMDRIDRFGCNVDGRHFAEGSKLPPSPNKPCEHCYCIRNMPACVMQECTLHIEGCTPVYHRDVCCPVRYSCDHPDDELPLLDNMTTTVRPTPGYVITTTAQPDISGDCFHNGEIYPDGAPIKMDKACEHCYCMKGDMVCVVQECGMPVENEGKNCIAAPTKEGECCPDTYICEDSDSTTTESELSITGYPKVTGIEGSGFEDGLTTLDDGYLSERTSTIRNELENKFNIETTDVFDTSTSQSMEPDVEPEETPQSTMTTDEGNDNIVTTQSTTDLTPIAEITTLNTRRLMEPDSKPSTEESKESSEPSQSSPTESELDQYPTTSSQERLVTSVEESEPKDETTVTQTSTQTYEENKTDAPLPEALPTTETAGPKQSEITESSETLGYSTTISLATESSTETDAHTMLSDDKTKTTIKSSDSETDSISSTMTESMLTSTESTEKTDISSTVSLEESQEDLQDETSEDTQTTPQVDENTESILDSTTLKAESSTEIASKTPELPQETTKLSSISPKYDDTEETEEYTTEYPSQPDIEQSTLKSDMNDATTTLPLEKEDERSSTEMPQDQDQPGTEPSTLKYDKKDDLTTSLPQENEGESLATTIPQEVNQPETEPSTSKYDKQDHTTTAVTEENESAEFTTEILKEQDQSETETPIFDKTTEYGQSSPKTDINSHDADVGLSTTLQSVLIDTTSTSSDITPYEEITTEHVIQELSTSHLDKTEAMEQSTATPDIVITEPTFEDTTQTPESQNSESTETVDSGKTDISLTSTEPSLRKEVNEEQPNEMESTETTTQSEEPSTKGPAAQSEMSITSSPEVSETEQDLEKTTSLSTTALDQKENEIVQEDITTPPIILPQIPGEGDCLVEGVTYSNESVIPPSPTNKCLTSCKCLSSIVKCEPIKCAIPPEDMINCRAIYESQDECCPHYECDSPKQTTLPGSYNQVAERETTIADMKKTESAETSPTASTTVSLAPQPSTTSELISNRFDSCKEGNCDIDSDKTTSSAETTTQGLVKPDSDSTKSPTAAEDSSTTATDSVVPVDTITPEIMPQQEPEKTTKSEKEVCEGKDCVGKTSVAPLQPSNKDVLATEQPTAQTDDQDSDFTTSSHSTSSYVPEFTEPDNASSFKLDFETTTREGIQTKEKCTGDDCVTVPTEISGHGMEATLNLTQKPCEGGLCEYTETPPSETTQRVPIPSGDECRGNECLGIKPTEELCSDDECKLAKVPESGSKPNVSKQPQTTKKPILEGACEEGQCEDTSSLPEEHTTIDAIEVSTDLSVAKIPCLDENCKTDDGGEKVPCAGDQCETESTKSTTMSSEEPCEGDSCFKNTAAPIYTDAATSNCDGEQCGENLATTSCNGGDCLQQPEGTEKYDEIEGSTESHLSGPCKGDDCASVPQEPDTTVSTGCRDGDCKNLPQNEGFECQGDNCKTSDMPIANVTDPYDGEKPCEGNDCIQPEINIPVFVGEVCEGDGCNPPPQQTDFIVPVIVEEPCIGENCQDTSQTPLQKCEGDSCQSCEQGHNCTKTEENIPVFVDESCKGSQCSPSETSPGQKCADGECETSSSAPAINDQICDGENCDRITEPTKALPEISSQAPFIPETCEGDDCTYTQTETAKTTEMKSPTISNDCLGNDCGDATEEITTSREVTERVKDCSIENCEVTSERSSSPSQCEGVDCLNENKSPSTTLSDQSTEHYQTTDARRVAITEAQPQDESTPKQEYDRTSDKITSAPGYKEPETSETIKEDTDILTTPINEDFTTPYAESQTESKPSSSSKDIITTPSAISNEPETEMNTPASEETTKLPESLTSVQPEPEQGSSIEDTKEPIYEQTTLVDIEPSTPSQVQQTETEQAGYSAPTEKSSTPAVDESSIMSEGTTISHDAEQTGYDKETEASLDKTTTDRQEEAIDKKASPSQSELDQTTSSLLDSTKDMGSETEEAHQSTATDKLADKFASPSYPDPTIFTETPFSQPTTEQENYIKETITPIEESDTLFNDKLTTFAESTTVSHSKIEKSTYKEEAQSPKDELTTPTYAELTTSYEYPTELQSEKQPEYSETTKLQPETGKTDSIEQTKAPIEELTTPMKEELTTSAEATTESQSNKQEEYSETTDMSIEKLTTLKYVESTTLSEAPTSIQFETTPTQYETKTPIQHQPLPTTEYNELTTLSEETTVSETMVKQTSYAEETKAPMDELTTLAYTDLTTLSEAVTSLQSETKKPEFNDETKVPIDDLQTPIYSEQTTSPVATAESEYSETTKPQSESDKTVYSEDTKVPIEELTTPAFVEMATLSEGTTETKPEIQTEKSETTVTPIEKITTSKPVDLTSSSEPTSISESDTTQPQHSEESSNTGQFIMSSEPTTASQTEPEQAEYSTPAEEISDKFAIPVDTKLTTISETTTVSQSETKKESYSEETNLPNEQSTTPTYQDTTTKSEATTGLESETVHTEYSDVTNAPIDELQTSTHTDLTTISEGTTVLQTKTESDHETSAPSNKLTTPVNGEMATQPPTVDQTEYSKEIEKQTSPWDLEGTTLSQILYGSQTTTDSAKMPVEDLSGVTDLPDKEPEKAEEEYPLNTDRNVAETVPIQETTQTVTELAITSSSDTKLSSESTSQIPITTSARTETESSSDLSTKSPSTPEAETDEPEQPEPPGYGGDDYPEEEQSFGPGTCKYGGKVYVSAQQIPRDDPCDFCFCFRSDIICLQQSCPPPIPGCHEEPISGFCCPRYECPVSMVTTLNVTTTTTTTTTTLPPHFPHHAYKGSAQRRGCHIKGSSYQVGEVVTSSSGPCMNCTCRGDGQMKCEPKACTPEPMLRQMIAAAVSTTRRRR